MDIHISFHEKNTWEINTERRRKTWKVNIIRIWENEENEEQDVEEEEEVGE